MPVEKFENVIIKTKREFENTINKINKGWRTFGVEGWKDGESYWIVENRFYSTVFVYAIRSNKMSRKGFIELLKNNSIDSREV